MIRSERVGEAVEKFIEAHEDDIVRGVATGVPDCYVIPEPSLRDLIARVEEIAAREAFEAARTTIVPDVISGDIVSQYQTVDDYLTRPTDNPEKEG